MEISMVSLLKKVPSLEPEGLQFYFKKAPTVVEIREICEIVKSTSC